MISLGFKKVNGIAQKKIDNKNAAMNKSMENTVEDFEKWFANGLTCAETTEGLLLAINSLKKEYIKSIPIYGLLAGIEQGLKNKLEHEKTVQSRIDELKRLNQKKDGKDKGLGR